ncbi:DUF6992 family protein [Rubrivirga sp. IMCC45206]|uniref:DUF6992 family protein n=1 Tax=Rubrivirga sp. IMCC45206 TaxID=3391614 RepID=UPI00398FA15C
MPPLRVLTALVLIAAPLAAQPVAEPVPSVTELSEALRADQRAHLWRVGAWGLANAVGGAALVLASDRTDAPGRWAFGAQSAAWGVVNVGIAAAGLAGGPGAVTGDLAAALAAENGYADVLLVNLGLNVGYAAVGATLLAVAGQGVATPAAWRGHGAALVVQGLGLLALDGIAYAATRARLGALLDLVGSADLAATAQGVVLVVPL